MKVLRIAAVAVVMAASYITPQAASAASLAEPPYFSQLRTCFEQSKQHGSAYLQACAQNICIGNNACAEEFCRMSNQTGAAWTECVARTNRPLSGMSIQQ